MKADASEADDASQQAWLESFVVDNPELERLEELLAEFNLFEAVGAVRQELRHSDFLSFLLNPSANHGLGDRFTKVFLKRVLLAADDPPISPVDIDVADLTDAIVHREWRNIDILIDSPTNNLVVAIENKIGSSEHSDQLRRYRETLERDHAGKQHICIFLTPEGHEASEADWIPTSYSLIAELVAKIAETDRSRIGPDLLSALKHYGTMLRRHIVSDSEIADLCQKIYKQHSGALDLIFEHRPDIQAEIAVFLRDVLSKDRDVTEDFSSKAYVRFAPQIWDSVPALRTGSGWTRSGRVLLFEFDNRPDSLRLKLQLGPGPVEVRKLVHDVALSKPDLFKRLSKTPGKRWTMLGASTIVLTASDLESLEIEDLKLKIESWWVQYRREVYPEIRDLVVAADWQSINLE